MDWRILGWCFFVLTAVTATFGSEWQVAPYLWIVVAVLCFAVHDIIKAIRGED